CPDDPSLRLLKAKILVTNVGDGPCDITFVGIGFARKRNERWLNGEVPDLRDNFVTNKVHLVAGKPRFIDIQGTSPLDEDAFIAVKQKRDELYILGQINYTDDLGTRRHTNFCWQWDVGTQDFRKPEKDDEWNYED